MNTMGTSRAVVVGIDGSTSALRAVRWAAAEVVRRNVPLRVVTAFELPPDQAVGRGGFGEDYREIVLGLVRRQLAEAGAVAEEALAGSQPAGQEVERRLVPGPPIPVLREESKHAQLLVLGDRGYGGVSGLLLGSVAVAMAALAECPVVLVRSEDGEPVEGRPVVVGVDGSPTSEAALAFAFEAASSRRVPLVAVHAWRELLVDPKAALLLDWEALEIKECEVLAERLAGWNEKYPDVQVNRVVVRDRPAHVLVDLSRAAQLVVVGSRGRTAAAGLLLGSVSHAVLHRAHCSVAVVRQPAAEKS